MMHLLIVFELGKKLTCLINFPVMATAEERKLELERKKQKLAEIREEKRRREEERRRNLLKNANLENGTGFFCFYRLCKITPSHMISLSQSCLCNHLCSLLFIR